MDLDLIQREYESTCKRLADQKEMLSQIEKVIESAGKAGTPTLERVAKIRARRYRDSIAESEKILSELQSFLPKNAELDLVPPAKGGRGGSHSSRT